MITQEELNAMNRASAEREAREAQQRYEMYGGVVSRQRTTPRRADLPTSLKKTPPTTLQV